ncbi:hypothetical protein AB0N59_04835 [Microbacterium sp. NPDC089321]|uniref:hypothetical protein n=1 Tax=Microbacterium sp. NPDC089321 TaxID=3155183 RepID=UPI003429DC96
MKSSLLTRETVKTPVVQCSLIAACLVLSASLLLFPDDRTWCVVVTLATISLWAEVRIHKLVRRNLIVRRSLKFVPYMLPVTCFGIDLEVHVPATVVATLAAGAYLIATRRQLQKALDMRLLSLMPKGTAGERWSETLFFVGSAAAQEYLHRFVLVTYCTELGVPGPIVVIITTATFVAEHFVGPNGHTARSRSNISLWVGMSIVFGGVVILLPPALSAVMLGHCIINAPAAIRPHLRGRSAKS